MQQGDYGAGAEAEGLGHAAEGPGDIEQDTDGGNGHSNSGYVCRLPGYYRVYENKVKLL